MFLQFYLNESANRVYTLKVNGLTYYLLLMKRFDQSANKLVHNIRL